jgi:hypothetical protein
MFSPILLYFLLTLLSSGMFFGIAIVMEMASNTFPGMLFHILGGFCPSLIAVIVVWCKYTPEARRNFWRSVLDFRRIRPSWWFITLLLIPVLVRVSVLLDVWLGAPFKQVSIDKQNFGSIV